MGTLAATVSLAAGAEPAGRPAAPTDPFRRRTGPVQLHLTFVVNCHDFLRPDRSGETVLRLVGLFERHGVTGEFYLTADIVEAWAKHCPEVIARLRDGRMTISYHYRPPHPVCFPTQTARVWLRLPFPEKLRLLEQLESHGWDLRTGRPRGEGPGGYLLVKKTFGRAPVTCGTGALTPDLRRAELSVLRRMGLRAVVSYHESGADPNHPLVWRDGLLVRPADFAVARYRPKAPPPAPGRRTGRLPFWWAGLAAGDTDADPTGLLRRRLAGLDGDRVYYAPALIHENDFYAHGPGWHAMYFDPAGRPRPGPWTRPDAETLARRAPLRTERQARAVWRGYERLVAFAAADRRIDVVTCRDMLRWLRPPTRAGAFEPALPRP